MIYDKTYAIISRSSLDYNQSNITHWVYLPIIETLTPISIPPLLFPYFYLEKYPSSWIHIASSTTLIQDAAWTHWPLEWFDWTSRFKILVNFSDRRGISCETALKWMALDVTDKSTLDYVTFWCHQATSRYLSQCWPRSFSPYGVTWSQ